MEKGIIPEAGPPGFMERMSDFALGRQFKALGDNLDRYGISAWLGERGQHRHGMEPWHGFMAVTGELCGVEVEADSGHPMAPTVRLTFDSRPGRRDFCELFYRLQAGITPGPDMPFCTYDKGWATRLVINRLSYPDLSTMGRVGSVLLTRCYSDVPGITALARRSVNTLNVPEGLSSVPTELAERIKHQLRVGGESPVSSGHLALIGKLLRAELQPKLPEGKSLSIQRPWGDRPHIEERAAFFATKTPVPFSSWSVGRMVADQVRERAHELAEPYRKRNVAKAGEDFVDMITGLGLLQGIGVAGRALATVVAAAGVATWGAISDFGDRRKRP